MRCILLFILAFPGIAFAGFAQRDDSKEKMEIMMHMLSLRNSLLSKDSITLDKILAADATYGHSNGLMQSKAQLIRSIMSREQDYKAMDPSGMNVRVYGTTGIVTTKLHVNLIYEGKPLDLNMNATLTWVKMDNDWKLVARQSVKIQAH